ncbi:hypothetical protein ACHHV8_09310 [Paenibacillus sp. TAB 01]|uniref:hypothetical protein n=1 Tax=Paenibacillus sp. TAB 01 TaxID=3368988 RepID=UPI003750F6D3
MPDHLPDSCPSPPIHAATADELKLLLQKSLTAYEIDQELERIESEERQLEQKISKTEQDIQTQQALSAETRKHAAKVLRAYYMGDRDSLWMLLFSTASFKDALTLFDYLQMIVRNDRDTLHKHLTNQKQLQELQSSLLTSKTSLEQAKARFLAQKDQRLQLQQQLDAELAKQPAAANAVILQQMAQLTVQWQDKGIPLFRTYFQALAQAMKQLPEMVSAPGTNSSQDQSGLNQHLIINGFQYTFQISDQDLNEFLRSKNPIFRNLNFQFNSGIVTASGKQDDMEVTIIGHYELATKGEDKPKTYVRFRMDQLRFNGFDLPQTTIEAMEKEFDLGIYPQMLASFLQVTGVQVENGKLSLLFKLAL